MIGLSERGADAAGKPHGILRRIEILGHDGEFVATQPADEIDLAGALLQPRRHLGEQRIAGSVTKRVVDVLKAVEVEAEHRHQVAVALAAGDRAVEMLVELQAVRQAGERVVHGEITNLILGEPALADAPRGDGRGHREAQDDEQACGQRHHRERDIGQGGGGGLVDGKSVNAGDLAVVRHRHEGEAVMGVARDRHRPDGVVVDGLRQGRAAAALAEHGL
jgi:hypothetical protein